MMLAIKGERHERKVRPTDYQPNCGNVYTLKATTKTIYPVYIVMLGVCEGCKAS